eukprot:TRINITY_DN87020_c0_g1_i1.p1 TRINITY_DN87020_c0_g1~~TRINITY_DN87020_c0_g1_i1.p1  ORF type:complete len:216 (+),score=15.05 TRINITY_DN87020_c0_g1_i1:37-684(+)
MSPTPEQSPSQPLPLFQIDVSADCEQMAYEHEQAAQMMQVPEGIHFHLFIDNNKATAKMLIEALNSFFNNSGAAGGTICGGAWQGTSGSGNKFSTSISHATMTLEELVDWSAAGPGAGVPPGITPGPVPQEVTNALTGFGKAGGWMAYFTVSYSCACSNLAKWILAKSSGTTVVNTGNYSPLPLIHALGAEPMPDDLITIPYNFLCETANSPFNN